MPTYAYACTACDHRFEAVQSFSDDSLTVCPECEGRLRKVFNAVGIVFKGGGFYRTDSRTDSRSSVTNGSATKGSGSSESSSGSSGSSEKSGKSSGSSDSSGGSSTAPAKPAASSTPSS